MAQVDIKTQFIDRDELQRFLPAKAYRLLKFFENLAVDVVESLPNAIADAVTGPNGAVDGNVPVFDGATGQEIRDSGIPITDLAQLDSPNFTGVPTAPTATPGTDTDQIATTAFVQAEVLDAVDGPASSTNNAIALFDGVSGKLLKDSAVLLTSLAPLDSPAFTNNPTAPTATVGDSDTTLATTAFVQGEFAARVALGAYFSAHNNGVAQSIPSGTPTKLTLGTEVYDVGSKFSGSTWTPPARLVSMSGAVTLPAVAGTRVGIAIYKNGAEFKRGSWFVNGGAAATSVATVSCQDVANGTDTYELWAFQDSGAAQNTAGGASLTHFQGTTIQA